MKQRSKESNRGLIDAGILEYYHTMMPHLLITKHEPFLTFQVGSAATPSSDGTK